MRLKALKAAIGSVVRFQIRKRMSEPTKLAAESMPNNISTATKLREREEVPLTSARDIAIFALFDLPSELIVAIIAETVNTVGFYRASRLRLVNKFFSATITDIYFSQENAYLLPNDYQCRTYWPSDHFARIAFTEVLEKKIRNETSPWSTLKRAINASIDLLESLHVPDRSLPSVTNHRQIYTGMLCASTRDILSMKEALQLLSATDQTVLESPLKGALTLASILGDVAWIEALITQGAKVDDRSAFFDSAIDAAAEYGKSSALILLNKYTDSGPRFIYSAIRGGHRDLVELFLDKCRAQTSPNPQGSDNSSNSKDAKDWKVRSGMIICAARNDQPAIMNVLLEYLPAKDRWEALQYALHDAIQYHAISAVSSLLEAGVDISRLVHYYGGGMEVACTTGDSKMVKLLLEHGYEDLQGRYDDCMHIAAAKGHTDIVQLYLDYGVNINCRFGNPLEMNNERFWEEMDTHSATTNAARRGDFHMFCFLVRRGAKVNLDSDIWVREGPDIVLDTRLQPLQQQWLDQIREWEGRFLNTD